MDGSIGFLTKFYEVLWDECFIVFQPSFSVVFMHPCVDLVELHSRMSSIFVAKELGLFVED